MATLTQAQKTAFKANFQANTTVLTRPNNTMVIMNTLTADSSPDDLDMAANWYNGNASPDFNVFKTSLASQDIFDQITWANYTPQDAPDNTVTWSNRSLACQGKQFNLQIMLQSAGSVNPSHINLRAGINDATTNLPSGVNGANKSGGWSNILPIMRRLANNLEKLFAVQTSGVGVTPADPLGATTNPALLVFEGTINGSQVYDALLNG